jgi:hypothetical protein
MLTTEFLKTKRGQTFPLVPRSLTEANKGYHDVAEVVRLFADGAPIHIAAHWIEGAQTDAGRDYSCAHTHDEFVEVNVLLGEPGALVYNVVLAEGDEPKRVESPCAIVVPPNVAHSANVLEGRGWFVVLRLPAE